LFSREAFLQKLSDAPEYIASAELGSLPSFLPRKREVSMKILMAAMSMGLGGAETHVFELSRALASRGHDVTVASAGGIYAEKLKEFGVKHEKIPLGSKDPFAVMRAFSLLSRLMERERFDIVHAHARIPAFVCGKLRKKYGFAFVTTVHFDFRVTPLLRRISDWGERTLAVSEDLLESAAAKYGLARENIAVIRNGIDTERFSPGCGGEEVRLRHRLSGKKVVMYLGRLDGDSFLPAKLLIDAAGEICREESEARILIVGEGTKKRELEAEAGRINKRIGAEAVIFADGTDKPEEYFAACDVFVGPSRSALEALSCGKPTVVAGSFGMLGAFSEDTASEALRTNLCCRGSESATAERIFSEVLRLLSLGREEKEALSAFGRGFVERNYGASAMADACEAEYTALLEKRGKSVVLCGYYGAGNAGDEAMLAVILGMLKSLDEVKQISVISLDPAKTVARHGVFAIARGDIASVSRALSAADALIFGGGNIFQDKTSTRSLVYYTQIAHIARKRACRVAFCACGIGPVRRAANLGRVKAVLSAADHVSMRDEPSRALAEELTGRSDIFTSGELAFLQRCDVEEKRMRYFAVFPKKVYGFDLSVLVRFCLSMRQRHGLIPVFAPMHSGEDARICRRLAKKTGGALCLRLENASVLASVCLFSFCMRLHAAVFSAASAVPFISVSDDPKTAALFDGKGYTFGADASEEALLNAAEDILSSREEKQKLLGDFAEEQRRLARAELERIGDIFRRSF
jgi:polysaccharide pyruvyl transferase CsaB